MTPHHSYPLSSDDVVVSSGHKRYRMAQSNGIELRCSGLAGWELWRHDDNGAQTRIESESEGNCGDFRIEIAGVPIFGKAQPAKQNRTPSISPDDPLQVLASWVREFPEDLPWPIRAALRAAELAAQVGERAGLHTPG